MPGASARRATLRSLLLAGLASVATSLAGGAAGVGGFLASERSAVAQPKAVSISLPFEKYKLDNGLEVVLHEDRRTPVVAVNIWYHVGSKDEAAGKNGFAHLFEHVMFQGSKHVAEDMFFKYL